MAIVKNLEMNQVYDWKEMAEAYPDSWLFLTDMIKDKGGVVIDGRLLAVSDYDDDDDINRALKEVKAYNKPYGCYRSTPDDYAIDSMW